MNIVKELRRKSGMQQKELALSVGVSSPTVSDWENGKKDPSWKNLKKLSEIFGVDALVILGVGKEAEKEEPKEDEDVMKIREQLRKDPNTRTLFDAALKASPEHIRAAAAMLKALEPEEPE